MPWLSPLYMWTTLLLFILITDDASWCLMLMNMLFYSGLACLKTRHAPSKYAKTHLRTSMSSEPLKSKDQELSNGMWHAYIEQYRSVIYRWKGLREHFSLEKCRFAYLSNTFCGRACEDYFEEKASTTKLNMEYKVTNILCILQKKVIKCCNA